MKKIALFLVAVIGFGILATAQDVIVATENSKVIEVSENDIRYILFDNPSVPTYYDPYQYTQCDMRSAKDMRNTGIALFSTGIAFTFPIGISLFATGLFLNDAQEMAGVCFMGIGSALTVSGIVMWAVGQTRMDRIKRFNPNGFSLFENEKVQFNLAFGGNSMGLKLNF